MSTLSFSHEFLGVNDCRKNAGLRLHFSDPEVLYILYKVSDYVDDLILLKRKFVFTVCKQK